MNMKEKLDKRICDVEEKATNTQTYREFIRESEKEFGIDELNLDKLTAEDLEMYVESLDYLWEK